MSLYSDKDIATINTVKPTNGISTEEFVDRTIELFKEYGPMLFDLCIDLDKIIAEDLELESNIEPDNCLETDYDEFNDDYEDEYDESENILRTFRDGLSKIICDYQGHDFEDGPDEMDVENYCMTCEKNILEL